MPGHHLHGQRLLNDPYVGQAIEAPHLLGEGKHWPCWMEGIAQASCRAAPLCRAAPSHATTPPSLFKAQSARCCVAGNEGAGEAAKDAVCGNCGKSP